MLLNTLKKRREEQGTREWPQGGTALCSRNQSSENGIEPRITQMGTDQKTRNGINHEWTRIESIAQFVFIRVHWWFNSSF
jgi:hypothetical protein